MYPSFLISTYLFLKTVFCSCHFEQGFENNHLEYKKRYAGHFPSFFHESSGLYKINDSLFLTNNDSGGDDAVFVFNRRFKITDTFNLPVKNFDWEEITMDDHYNIYVGDFGNNYNVRKDLKIYKYSPTSEVQTIRFSYPDQKDYPPSKKEKNFDCESFVWYKGQLHLFSKNRGSKCVKHYVLPDSPVAGNEEVKARLVEEKYLKGQVTGASLSQNDKLLALLSYGKIYLFNISDSVSISNPYKCIKLGRGGQSEGIAFVNNTDMLVSNEKGKLFWVKKRRK